MKKFYSFLLLAAIGLFGAQNLMAQDTWTVAGGSTELFGTSWAPDNTANDMVLNGSVYEFVANDVELSAGTIEFKVVKNHNWNQGSYPSNNYQFLIAKSGTHNVIITFDPSSHNVSASDVCTNEHTVRPVVQVAGNFVENGWSSGAITLTPAANYETASANVTIAEGQYEMKVVLGGAWKTISNTSNWITRVAHADWIFTASGDNASFDADMAGVYTFTYAYETGALTITYPQTYTRHFEHAYYSTICLPQAAALANATAYEIASIADGYVSLTEPVANLVAGKPYIIKPTADDVDVVATLSGDPTDNTVPGANGLWGVIDQDGEPTVSDGNYVLSENMFRLVAGGAVNVPRFRGGLWVDAQGAPELRIAENATNIESLDASENAVKFIKNGQLFIQKNGVVYNAVGAVVE